MKSIGIVHIHLRKMPLKFWGIVPTPSGPWGLRSDGHHGWGGLINMAGRKNDMAGRKGVGVGVGVTAHGAE